MRALRVDTPTPPQEREQNQPESMGLGLGTSSSSTTKIEINAQIPTCRAMAKDRSTLLYPDCSWEKAKVDHWIKVNSFVLTPFMLPVVMMWPNSR